MPARFRDIKRAVAFWGITSEPPSSGSHWKLRDPSGKMYPLPCSNGERSEIPDKYLRAMCRTFGIDEDELRRKL